MQYDEWNCLEPVLEVRRERDLYRAVYLLGDVEGEHERQLVVFTGTCVNVEPARKPARWILFRFSQEERLAYGVGVETIVAPLRFIRWAGPPQEREGVIDDSYDDGY